MSPRGLGSGRFVLVLALVCTACRTTSAREVPARFPAQADDACRAQLTGAIASELKAHVVLVPETLTDGDRLLISRVTRRGPDGRLLDGRSLETPEEFRLKGSDGGCSIVHVRTGHRAALPACRCVAWPPG